LARRAPRCVHALVPVSGYYYPETRIDLAVAGLDGLPLLGDVTRYTTSPIVGAIMLRRLVDTMFYPAAVPRYFIERYPLASMIRPWQLRAAGEDALAMNPAAQGLASW
jgi:hypothetical protein